MRSLLLSLLFSMMALVALPATVWANAAPAAGLVVSVKSFREWKNERVLVAQARLAGIKGRLDARKDPNLLKTKGFEGRDMSSQQLEELLKNEAAALETAQDLTVSDYFAGYLAKQSNKASAYKEVAGKLSPDEVAELMSAYANSVLGTQGSSLPSSARNLRDDTSK